MNKDWQVPSWCDRILTRSFPGCLLRQLDYYSTPTMFGSDHRPVAAIFQFVPLPAPDVLSPAFEQRTRDNVCEVRLSDLRVELEEWREGLEMEELKAVHALRTGSGGSKQSQGGGHWAENLSGSELVLRADFSSPVFARNIFKKSRKNRKSTSSKRRVDKGFTWSPLSFEASIADDDYVRRHHIVVGVTIQAPDQTIINLGYAVIPLLGSFRERQDFKVDVVHAGLKTASMSGDVVSLLNNRNDSDAIGFRTGNFTISSPKSRRAARFSVGKSPSAQDSTVGAASAHGQSDSLTRMKAALENSRF